jgi:hypothetical protein
MISMLSSSLTRFFGSSVCGRFQTNLVLPSSMKARAMAWALPRSICALGEPAAPKARRQNCRRTEAVFALRLMRSSAKVLVSSSLSFSSSTSSPLTIAPVGLIRSWQTREHRSAARSRASRATAADMRGLSGGERISGCACWMRFDRGVAGPV